MWNLFRKPIETETLDGWAKMAEDIAKVAFLAIPVTLYGNDALHIKIINVSALLLGVYGFLICSRVARKFKLKEEK